MESQESSFKPVLGCTGCIFDVNHKHTLMKIHVTQFNKMPNQVFGQNKTNQI